ncbi:phosphate signaling complex protein PhoU [Anaerosphaera multitolerans]|uniref:Phosphate-specific transport system accessory protein PhoU n=1 Tax=Anaerosphaera multitolerans TaxID=2487351 RepID=A0A437S4X3_9FIRM|nr:phosphate signaling complex protein PhoU [Anaerosphaera multitolerans]RVU54059.1 phosphate signaling complex protein PhoU [Anaerosphaera multitolerans]
MRSRFDEELEELNEQMLRMGMLVEAGIEKAVSMLDKRDEEKAKEVIRYEEEIDNMEYEIQVHCLRLLIEQQPVARDLRKISAALKIITDMERIGDQSRDIAEICMYVDLDKDMQSVQHVKEMAESTIDMVNGTIKAFVDGDIELARQIQEDDDIVDDYFVKVRDDLIKLIREEDIEPSYIIDVLMIAKYLERIADHAVNISEWVIFTVEG